MLPSVWLQKQTQHATRKLIPLAINPLTRWSRCLPKWTDLGGALTYVKVGLEGCHSAFNATNSIRTCLYFQTASPPTFLTASSWEMIEHVQVREPTPDDFSTSESQEEDVLDLKAVAHLRKESCASVSHPFDGIALFGEDVYFSELSSSCRNGVEIGPASAVECPLVALENFADRAQSLMHTRLPAALSRSGGGIRLVVGHENGGVRRSLLRVKGGTPRVSLCDHTRDPTSAGISARTLAPVTDMVVYVPQFGTISSLNVVTSLGIALFYCYMDAACPEAREVFTGDTATSSTAGGTPADSGSPSSELDGLRHRLQEYQSAFSRALPTPESTGHEGALAAADAQPTWPHAPVAGAAVNTTPRVDRRPLHPAFYQRSSEEIQHQQRLYRQALLQYSVGQSVGDSASRQGSSEASGSSTSLAASFGLSVLYENEYDQRNFGGLIRSANAFLVDYVFYVGRRKVNVVGAVGSYHYTPPMHLGALPDPPSAAPSSDAMADGITCAWAAEIRARVEAKYKSNAPRSWWLLDCGHDFLYASALDSRPQRGGCDVDAAASHPASLQAFRRMKARGQVRSLCDSAASLREAAGGGLVLLIPQEGRLPHPGLMGLCTGVLTVLPEGVHFGERAERAMVGASDRGHGHRGLPSQVASGIALQRLSSVLHPRLAAL
ncbi:hypothetical protein LSCM1_01818 [Leishmania martiniquensis]|uniref:tRNA/rRNA methyltransferase SpoU type domain-containing protein n=1 Tax=Leishmania martiniquensis TaxID=1580590 RepID=A0A836GEB9_9TRYP|nr:hypothetical protein LSCM1_01818 [Leishmania martiniquensis]